MEQFGKRLRALNRQGLQDMRLEVAARRAVLLCEFSDPVATGHGEQRDIVLFAGACRSHEVTQTQALAMPLARKEKRCGNIFAVGVIQSQAVVFGLGRKELIHRLRAQQFFCNHLIHHGFDLAV